MQQCQVRRVVLGHTAHNRKAACCQCVRLQVFVGILVILFYYGTWHLQITTQTGKRRAVCYTLLVLSLELEHVWAAAAICTALQNLSGFV